MIQFDWRLICQFHLGLWDTAGQVVDEMRLISMRPNHMCALVASNKPVMVVLSSGWLVHGGHLLLSVFIPIICKVFINPNSCTIASPLV